MKRGRKTRRLRKARINEKRNKIEEEKRRSIKSENESEMVVRERRREAVDKVCVCVRKGVVKKQPH